MANIAERIKSHGKWTGATIAELVLQSKVPWNSGHLTSGSTSCAVGILARELGASARVIEHASSEAENLLGAIFELNDEDDNGDTNRSRQAAAARIKQEAGHRKFDVCAFQQVLATAAEALGEELKPNCRLLSKVTRRKRSHK
jgi:hypothetical protein